MPNEWSCSKIILCPHSFDVNLCCFCRLTSDISDMIETDDLDIFTLPDLEQYNVSIYYVTDSVTWQEAWCTFLSQPNFVVWKKYHMIIWKEKNAIKKFEYSFWIILAFIMEECEWYY